MYVDIWMIAEVIEKRKGSMKSESLQQVSPGAPFTVVIPARNEESFLPQCLSALNRAAAYAATTFQLIVVVNRSTDRTEEIARAAGAEIVASDAMSLSIIRNAGLARARGEIVVTVDADSRVSQRMFAEIAKYMKRPNVVGGAVAILPERLSAGIFLTGLMLLPWVIRHRISGGLFFARRETWIALGGFDESLVSVEDIDFAKRLRACGKARGQRFVVLVRAWITTSCRKFDRLGDWYFIRNPREFWRIMGGRDAEAANRFWYLFPR